MEKRTTLDTERHLWSDSSASVQPLFSGAVQLSSHIHLVEGVSVVPLQRHCWSGILTSRCKF